MRASRPRGRDRRRPPTDRRRHTRRPTRPCAGARLATGRQRAVRRRPVRPPAACRAARALVLARSRNRRGHSRAHRPDQARLGHGPLDVGLADGQLLPRPNGASACGANSSITAVPAIRLASGARAAALVRVGPEPRGQEPSARRRISPRWPWTIAERLFHRFQPLGVYDPRRCARSPTRRPATPWHCVSLDRRPSTSLPLRRLPSAGDRDPKSRSVILQSIRPISEHTFVKLIDMGADGAA